MEGNTVLIICADKRLQPVFQKQVETRYGLKPGEYFVIAIPGAAGALAYLDQGGLGRTIADFLNLLRAERIIATNHGARCAAYANGGIEFSSSAREREYHFDQLRMAEEALKLIRPDAVVNLGYFDKEPTEIGRWYLRDVPKF